MLWNRFILGYHGCDADLAKRIVCREDSLLPSENNYDWLGNGIYFWEGSAQRAYEWAQTQAQSAASAISNPGVLGAVIDLGECLNLIEAEALEIVEDAYTWLNKLAWETGTALPVNSESKFGHRLLDCAVFEALHGWRREENLPAFDTVRAFFIEGEPVYPTSGIRHRDHIQICVRNPDQIIGYFLP